MSMASAAEPKHRPFHISAFPAGVTRWENPYFRLCHAALAKRGISVSDDLEIDLRWIEVHKDRVDAVHLHWPERFWRRRFGGASRIQRAAQASECLFRLHRFVRAARRRHVRCIWTVHNLEPHEGAYRWDHYGYRLLARNCDVVICHSESAARNVCDAYHPRGRVVVMPIGDPAPAYPRARSRAEVLGEVRLDPERPVVSCLGRLRPYKGLDVACAAVERLNGRVQLIIGGLRHGELDAAPIFAAIGRTRGVVIDRELTDQEFADLTAASDAVLLPYRAITGSGALLTALGLGRGAVTSDLPYFREMLAGEPDAGMLVSGWDTDAWANALLQYLERPAPARSRAALRLAARYHWDRCVEPLVAALGIETGAGAGQLPTVAAAC
jgi:beta-1,4-mannosyltransferase